MSQLLYLAAFSLFQNVSSYLLSFNAVKHLRVALYSNGLKLRGHLGSELQRKAAVILSIEKDDEPQISVVKTLKVSDGSPLDVLLVFLEKI